MVSTYFINCRLKCGESRPARENHTKFHNQSSWRRSISKNAHPNSLSTRNRLIPSTSAIPISKAGERQGFQRHLACLALITRVIRRDVQLPLSTFNPEQTVNRGWSWRVRERVPSHVKIYQQIKDARQSRNRFQTGTTEFNLFLAPRVLLFQSRVDNLQQTRFGWKFSFSVYIDGCARTIGNDWQLGLSKARSLHHCAINHERDAAYRFVLGLVHD
jgi:hypothetical protein